MGDDFAFDPSSRFRVAGKISSYFPVTRDESPDWQGRRGRISEALLTEALPSTDSLCLVCGPPQLVSDTRSLLEKLGVGADQILVEKY